MIGWICFHLPEEIIAQSLKTISWFTTPILLDGNISVLSILSAGRAFFREGTIGRGIDCVKELLLDCVDGSWFIMNYTQLNIYTD